MMASMELESNPSTTPTPLLKRNPQRETPLWRKRTEKRSQNHDAAWKKSIPRSENCCSHWRKRRRSMKIWARELYRSTPKSVFLHVACVKCVIRFIVVQISHEQDCVHECQSVARKAEVRVQAVMKAAQSAVTVELESKAVLKETETAFNKAMSEIDILESQELDTEGAKRIRAEM